MSILPIYICGDPVLHKPAEPVTEFDRELAELVDSMYETTEYAPGVGLAAPQVGVGKRLFVWMYEDQDVAEPRGVAINPELWIAPLEPGEAGFDEEEGCLSFPGEHFALRRSLRARLRAQDLNGKWFEFEAEGWFARIMQHEYDHLNGILYIDRLIGPEAYSANKVRRKKKWTTAGNTWTPRKPRS